MKSPSANKRKQKKYAAARSAVLQVWSLRTPCVMRDYAGQVHPGSTTSPSIGAEGAPHAATASNAFAERSVRSVRHELLHRTLIWNHRLLRRLLDDPVAEVHSPRSLQQHDPGGETVTGGQPHRLIERHTVCAGHS